MATHDQSRHRGQGGVGKEEEEEEEAVKVEAYDGAYDCVVCCESVRGTDALRCSQCSANPFHRACVLGSTFADTCAQCEGRTIVPWKASPREAGAAAEMIDLAGQAHVLKHKAQKKQTTTMSAITCNLREGQRQRSMARAPKRSQATSMAEVVEDRSGRLKTMVHPPFTPRSNLGAVAVGTKIFAIGGLSELKSHGSLSSRMTAHDMVEIYDSAAPDSGWVVGPQLRQCRWGHVAVVVAAKIYVLGGYSPYYPDYGDLVSVEVLDTEDLASGWQAGPELTKARQYLAAVSIGTKIYVIGGKSDDDEDCGLEFGCLDLVEVLDTTTIGTGWSPLPSLPLALGWQTAVAVGDTIFAMGGYDNKDERSGTVFMLDTSDSSRDWKWGPPLTHARSVAGSAAIGSKIYVLGGANYIDGIIGSVEMLDLTTLEITDLSRRTRPRAGKWAQLPPLRHSRCAPGVVAIGMSLFAFGGFFETQSSEDRIWLGGVECLNTDLGDGAQWLSGPVLTTTASDDDNSDDDSGDSEAAAVCGKSRGLGGGLGGLASVSFRGGLGGVEAIQQTGIASMSFNNSRISRANPPVLPVPEFAQEEAEVLFLMLMLIIPMRILILNILMRIPIYAQ